MGLLANRAVRLSFWATSEMLLTKCPIPLVGQVFKGVAQDAGPVKSIVKVSVVW